MKTTKNKTNLRFPAILPVMLIFLCFAAARAETLTVTNTNDGGAGSLRQAIADAGAGDTIDFNLLGCPCTITLTAGGLVIDKNLTIKGPGAAQLKVSANYSAPFVFNVDGGSTAALSGLTIAEAGGLSGTPSAGSRGTEQREFNRHGLHGFGQSKSRRRRSGADERRREFECR